MARSVSSAFDPSSVSDPTEWQDQAEGIKAGGTTGGGRASNLGNQATGAGSKQVSAIAGSEAQTNWGAVASVGTQFVSAAVGGGGSSASLIANDAIGASEQASAVNSAVSALDPQTQAQVEGAQENAVEALNAASQTNTAQLAQQLQNAKTAAQKLALLGSLAKANQNTKLGAATVASPANPSIAKAIAANSAAVASQTAPTAAPGFFERILIEIEGWFK